MYSPQYPILKHLRPTILPQCQRPSFTPIKTTGKIMFLYIIIYIFWINVFEHRFFKWVSLFRPPKPSAEDWEGSDCPCKCRVEENVQKVLKIFNETEWQVGLLSGTQQQISKRGSEHAAALRAVWASIAQRRTEQRPVFLPGSAGWSQKRLKLPLDDHNKRRKLNLRLLSRY